MEASTAFALPAEMTIYTATETRAAWLPLLQNAHDTPFTLDGSAVQDVDATGLQLLLALRRSAQERQLRLVVHHPSPALRAALGLAGLLHVLVPEATP